jgi:hypothetical protein
MEVERQLHDGLNCLADSHWRQYRRCCVPSR